MLKKLYIVLTFILASLMLSFAGKTLIYLEHSETLDFDEEKYPDCQILNGNVVFRHEEALMYCDKAYFYNKSNNISAHGNIKMIQGDSLTVYADHLFYNGDTKMARLRHNVRMENKLRQKSKYRILLSRRKTSRLYKCINLYKWQILPRLRYCHIPKQRSIKQQRLRPFLRYT